MSQQGIYVLCYRTKRENWLLITENLDHLQGLWLKGRLKMHFLQVECKSSSRSGADPDLQLRGVWGRRPRGVQRQSPWSGVRGTKSPRSWCHFLISETNFLTKLSHKFGKFRLHGERQRRLCEHRGWGTVPLFTYLSVYSRPRPTATAC